MAVFRVEKTRNYTVMSNYHLRDIRISFKAKGLLSLMLSLPENWDYTMHGLAAISKEGVDAISTGLRELERAGYVDINRVRNENGIYAGTEYIIREVPKDGVEKEPVLEREVEETSPKRENPVLDEPILENPILDNPGQEKPILDNPVVENPPQINKDIQTTEEQNKEELNTDCMKYGSNQISSTDEVTSNRTPDIPDYILKLQRQSPYASVYEEINRMRREREERANTSYEHLLNEIKNRIEYEYLLYSHEHEKELIDNMVDIMAEVLISEQEYVTVAGGKLPAQVVKERLKSIDSSHMEYVLKCFKENTTKVKNIKQYLKAILFNAPQTMDAYYSAMVSHDEHSF